MRSPASRPRQQDRQAVLAAANAPRFARLSPYRIVPAVAERVLNPGNPTRGKENSDTEAS